MKRYGIIEESRRLRPLQSIEKTFSFQEDQLPALLAWADAFPFVHYSYHHGIPYPMQGFPHLLAVGSKPAKGDSLKELLQLQKKHPSWLFGFLGYDLKNHFYPRLKSENKSYITFPDFHFFEPEIMIEFMPKKLVLHCQTEPEKLWQDLQLFLQDFSPAPGSTQKHQISSPVSRKDYLQTVEAIRHHIYEGDVYELNYCMPWEVENVQEAPYQLFARLSQLSPAPFSAYAKWHDRYLLSASPERFLRKTGDTLLSQPIKGTIRRGKTAEEDEALKAELAASEKERAENMMIVDLVRNDLAKVSEPGTVNVPELFGIHGFRQVFQMISSIESQLKPHTSFYDILRATFPMGSMTGAPKHMAMQLIEQYEVFQRNLFSGSVGFITPEGNADFNVVIRSILLDTAAQFALFPVGSAITYDAQATAEWDECQVKVSAMRSLFEG